jgi:hypothetical protein
LASVDRIAADVYLGGAQDLGERHREKANGSHMTLRQKQSLFVSLVAKLIEYAYANGMELTFGECWRTPEQAKRNAQTGSGISNSLHVERLAIDLNLFVAGVFIDSSEGHRRLGEYWKSLHPSCRWGGDFRKPDGNHYSFSPDGVRG